MGIFLWLLSIVLSIIMFPAGYLFGFFKQIYKRKFFKSFRDMNDKFYKQACSIDRYGNIVCAELFNQLLIKQSSPHKFGNDRETISSTLGRNYVSYNLTRLGRRICAILNWIDKDHVTKSIGF